MIPPANMIQEDTTSKDNEREQREPQSPTSISQQESKLQRLKRSLSFKTKSLRSKSADHFFLRPIEDVKFQSDLLSDVSSSTGHLSTLDVSVSTPPVMSLPPPPPPLPPVIPGNLPITICSPSRAPRQTDPNAHTFLEHIFKKPQFCDVCNHMIVACQGGAGKVFGTNAKLGLRCKACKMGIHHKCLDGVGQQRCMGKLTSDVAQVPEEKATQSRRAQLVRKPSDNVFMPLENGTEHFHFAERKSEGSPSNRELKKDPLLLKTYVALFRFSPQDSQDLEMRPGDRIILADDSSDDWWKGVIEDRIGFFPASFAHQVKVGDRVFRCNRTFIGCKEQGQMTLKEGQICVSSEDEHSGFIRVASGKKRGFVPCDILENIYDVKDQKEEK
ncbi:SH3 and cysteine-rich domain-containing protein-like isoform X3 [Myxocyprinus asiaticus]|uniref:SH3 and cysteine-rich domain-containing protein-like isoform X3 n=1 Tax=Myxocyprinus asiaticus TaxID=70543 RepID=UPI0022220AF8|nr:SH3 and cysteine-rich domain-containing protein-like isoform X3 [Myxocyprinus asiaticus]